MSENKRFNVAKVVADADAWTSERRDDAESAMESIINDAEDGVRTVIRTSITITGQGRASRGRGISGRVETGSMYDDVSSKVETSESEIVGRWGWEHPKDYYQYQEDGTRYIAEMDALGTTMIEAEDRLGGALDKIVRRG